jgi:uncharacterized membrane protein YeiB
MLPVAREDCMKTTNGLAHLASAFVILMSTVSLSMAAANSYHLLKKYSFGPAEGSTRKATQEGMARPRVWTEV